MALAQLTPEARQSLDLPADAKGVVVTEVQPGSPAAEKGLQPGDVIVEADRTQVSDPAMVAEAVRKAAERGKDAILLLVKRDGQNRFVAVPLRARLSGGCEGGSGALGAALTASRGGPAASPPALPRHGSLDRRTAGPRPAHGIRFDVESLLYQGDAHPGDRGRSPRPAEYLAKGLRESGHAAEVVGDGRDGLLQAATGRLDVLIVDRMLPGLDGLSLVHHLRATGHATPVLFLSALGEVDDRVKGLRAGGDDYLVKPYAFSELLARVENLARRRTHGAGHDQARRSPISSSTCSAAR